jgi:hypothetical protein
MMKEPRREDMSKYLKLTVFVILVFGLASCNIRTPEIKGVVLDQETRQPVAEAWVTATLQTKTRTIQGNVYSYLSVDPPHTRTDKDGKFIIPGKKFRKPTFPVGFGTVTESFGVGARTVDWRGGGVEIKDLLGKGNKIEVVINIRRAEKVDEEKIMAYLKDGVTKERADQIIEQEYFSSLQALYNYCLTGRSSVEVPPVEGGCDEWELDYVIAKYEWYLGKYKENVEKEVNTVIFDRLAYLYEKKGDLNKAIETLKKSIALIEGRGLLRLEVWQRNKKGIEWRINELGKKLPSGHR